MQKTGGSAEEERRHQALLARALSLFPTLDILNTFSSSYVLPAAQVEFITERARKYPKCREFSSESKNNIERILLISLFEEYFSDQRKSAEDLKDFCNGFLRQNNSSEHYNLLAPELNLTESKVAYELGPLFEQLISNRRKFPLSGNNNNKMDLQKFFLSTFTGNLYHDTLMILLLRISILKRKAQLESVYSSKGPKVSESSGGGYFEGKPLNKNILLRDRESQIYESLLKAKNQDDNFFLHMFCELYNFKLRNFKFTTNSPEIIEIPQKEFRKRKAYSKISLLTIRNKVFKLYPAEDSELESTVFESNLNSSRIWGAGTLQNASNKRIFDPSQQNINLSRINPFHIEPLFLKGQAPFDPELTRGTESYINSMSNPDCRSTREARAGKYHMSESDVRPVVPSRIWDRKSQESAIKTSQESAIKTSQESAIKGSQESAIKGSQESANKASQESAIKANQESAITTTPESLRKREQAAQASPEKGKIAGSQDGRENPGSTLNKSALQRPPGSQASSFQQGFFCSCGRMLSGGPDKMCERCLLSESANIHMPSRASAPNNLSTRDSYIYVKTSENSNCRECKATPMTEIAASCIKEYGVCEDCYPKYKKCDCCLALHRKDYIFENGCQHRFCVYCLDNIRKPLDEVCLDAGNKCKQPLSRDPLRRFMLRLHSDSEETEGQFKCCGCLCEIKLRYKYFEKPRVITCVECNSSICVKDNKLIDRCLCSCPKCHRPLQLEMLFERKLCSFCSSQYCGVCLEQMDFQKGIICQCRCLLCSSPIKFKLNSEKSFKICETCVRTCGKCEAESASSKQIITFKSCVHRVCRRCYFESTGSSGMKQSLGSRTKCPLC